MAQYSAIWNHQTRRWVTRNSKTHRKLMQQGLLPVFEDDTTVLAYIKNLPESEVNEMKNFYKSCPDLEYTAVLGRGCYAGYLVKRMKTREDAVSGVVDDNVHNNNFIL